MTRRARALPRSGGTIRRLTGWLARRAPLCSALAAFLFTLQGAPAPTGIDLTVFDRAVRPQDDLYRHVNGGWVDRTILPPERAFYAAYTALADKVDDDLRRIIEELATRPSRSRVEQKIVDLYLSMIDVTRLDALGHTPIQPQLDRIAGVRTREDFARVVGELSTISATGPFGLNVTMGPGGTDQLVLHLAQGGLLMGDRSYYLSPAPAMARIREEYASYLERILTLVAWPRAAEQVAAVISLEKQLAGAHWSRTDSRDLRKTSNRAALFDLPRLLPGFDWLAWADPQGFHRVTWVVIAQPSFFATFARLSDSVSLETWKTWLATRYITALAPYLSTPFNDARFEHFGRVLVGQQDPRARWKRGVSMVSGYLGDALGRLYVERYFPKRSRDRIDRIVEHVIDAYRDAVKQATWLTAGTRAGALAKLIRLDRKIGYPDSWRRYDALDIRPDDLVGNLQRALRYDNQQRLLRVGRRTLRGEWLMTPQTVNAYYAPALNEIVFPAAMLQPPFFFPEAADEAVNYGAIGAVIGHEIGHAFDEQGRLYDADGRRTLGWPDVDAQAYRRRLSPLIEHYGRFEALPGIYVNGRQTLSENAGDLAGLQIAFQAYERSLDGDPAPVIGGLTGEQRFFMGWAQLWRAKERDGYTRQTVLTGLHAPSSVRANGPLSHLDAFYRAFDVKPGDRLYLPPGERVRLWYNPLDDRPNR